MTRRPHPASDLALSLLLLVIAALLLGGAAQLPPPQFDPLGSAALPRILAGLLIVFALITGARAVLLWRAGGASDALPWSPGAAARGAAVLGLLVAFILVMAAGLAPFWAAGTVYVAASALLIGGFTPRRLVVTVLGGLALCAVLTVVFTRFFYINLP
ncbi:tripartite tricarboxylate transporter TctB family protein [Oceanicella sp. SM1341]|uniref:tripartite tricarboxylate transporter TctB family protein n=1 Tax=Oceanicella sp. SM1341 TaxID=1548889 RepID=UPI000E4F46AC|nr:tripartite tricarboxylate transporter TctB family protein [Oceanicella sp. SM1341]